MTFFARAWNGPEAPGTAAGIDVEGSEVTAVRGIATGNADDDFVFDDQRRGGDVAAALAHVFDVYPPQLPSCLLIQCDDVIIERAGEYLAGAHRQAASPGT